MNFLENKSSAKYFLSQRKSFLRSSLLKFMKVYFIEKISPKQKFQTLLACFFDQRTKECLTKKENKEVENKLLH